MSLNDRIRKILDEALLDKCLNHHLHRPDKAKHNCRNYSCLEMMALGEKIRNAVEESIDELSREP